MTPLDRYGALCAEVCDGEVICAVAKRGFGAGTLTYRGKIFAMLVRGRLVVKLSVARAAELVSLGWGAPFDANRGRPMKAWLVVAPSREEDWRALAEEALAHARSSLKP